jgi:pyruvate,orthophosphate dikinase
MKEVYQQEAGHPFPQDPIEQLLGAVGAVMRSWNCARATDYRALEGLTDLTGTAVTIQAMVFGNMGVTSGSGVGFTRDPATGEDRLYVDFLLNAQGEDVVGGRRTAADPEELVATLPNLAHEVQTVRRRLEMIFHEAQDFEFTVEEGKLWLLQTRTAKRTPLAALRIACDLVDEGLIDPVTAVERLRDHDLDSISYVTLADEDGAEAIGRGMAAGAGVASGRVALSVDAAQHYDGSGEPVVLVRQEASTEDISGLAICRALVTATGARTSHAAVVARQLGVVCVVGCTELSVDLARGRVRVGRHELREGQHITVNGGNGVLYEGELELHVERPDDLVARVRGWEASARPGA